MKEIKWLKTSNGERCDSLSAMIKFQGECVWSKVFTGYMSYDVIHLRCFKCQIFWHLAAICKGKQWCGRCAGEHEYVKCERAAKDRRL